MILEQIINLVILLIAFKAITIGSNFNFHKWMKNRKEYMEKYNDWISKQP